MLIQEQMGARVVSCFIGFILLPFALATADSGSKQIAQELSVRNLVGSGEINEDMVTLCYLYF